MAKRTAKQIVRRVQKVTRADLKPVIRKLRKSEAPTFALRMERFFRGKQLKKARIIRAKSIKQKRRE